MLGTLSLSEQASQDIPIGSRHSGDLNPAHDVEVMPPPVTTIWRRFEVTRDVVAGPVGWKS